ncbi:MAG: hypothetical protein KatS3mg081_2839 [Gemmatimonadales bacterium]|nr:MAG: hypothetical protein KatS3mg081_2839 [Gemmatimonadales bacterium]
MRALLFWLVAGVLWAPAAVEGQESLAQTAERARRMWMAHDMSGLVGSSDTLRVQLPGVGRSASLSPAQAIRVLLRYVEGAEELSLDLRAIRSAGPGHGYVEARRRYVVGGTRDEREETVFLGYRHVGGEWRLREVRVVR